MFERPGKVGYYLLEKMSLFFIVRVPNLSLFCSFLTIYQIHIQMKKPQELRMKVWGLSMAAKVLTMTGVRSLYNICSLGWIIHCT